MTPGYEALIAYVPVHGGITYAQGAPDGSMVYGFDCAHSGDTILRYSPLKFKARSQKWLVQQCEQMAAGILAAARYEQAYHAADGDDLQRAAVIDNFHRYLDKEGFGKFKLTDNLGAMLKLIFGGL